MPYYPLLAYAAVAALKCGGTAPLSLGMIQATWQGNYRKHGRDWSSGTKGVAEQQENHGIGRQSQYWLCL